MQKLAKKTASLGLKKLRDILVRIDYLFQKSIEFIDLARFIYIDFIPRKSDIFIVTYPRSGTTWMQMILYQLTSDGDMNFTHIGQVVPFFESCNKGILNSLPSPRVFKTHLSSRWIPKFWRCKYIYVVRNGKDVAVSNYNFFTKYQGYNVQFTKFFDDFLSGQIISGSWIKHVTGWLSRSQDSQILLLSYEECKQDLKKCIEKIIDFCELNIQSERIPEILNKCSFEFMKSHEDKFDPAVEMRLNNVNSNAFIHQGKVGSWREYLTLAQEKRYQRELNRHSHQLGSLINKLS